MYNLGTLKQSDRDKIMESLGEDQKKFLMYFLKRGKRSAFANIMAKEKAGFGQGRGDTGDIANQWELLDFIDAGSNWRDESTLFCECNRKLRYQYVVQNRKTDEVKKFGITHFELHTGIPSFLAKQILKGLEKIDFELDEVLQKISNGWDLKDEGIFNIPSEIDIPNDIQNHFDCDIPLLERQISRLKQMVLNFEVEMERKCREEQLREQERVKKEKESILEKLKQETVNSEWWQGLRNGINTSLSEDLQLGIILYLRGLKTDVVKASDICDELISYHGAPSNLLPSGMYRIFPDVCLFLEELSDLGRLKSIEKRVGQGVYQIVDPHLLV